MAVYSKLLLSAGGGIVSATQQAEQAKNTATVLIGLGGTGIDALRTIKTQVYSRLKADDPEAIIPQYEHIRFLGVDSAEKTRGDQEEENQDNLKEGSLRVLDDNECFSIANLNVRQVLSNPRSLDMRDELSWLCHETIDAPSMAIGAGGIRQVGRFMMMDKSYSFMSRIEKEIKAAKAGLNNPPVNIHIFSGLSGGTGSGCFLDVCYMVRHIANKIGGATIFGYFFLPDVNLSVITDKNVREYVPRNGYAAMQELDYCMQLQFNGGGFVQQYQNHTLVDWKGPPVDMCHLICATDAANNVIENAYEYAMNVTAEYIMDFLTHTTSRFGLDQHLTNFNAMVGGANGKKSIGSPLAYCVIGASCANIPLREINTYLASELFEKFSCIGGRIPSKTDVEAFAIAALARNAQSLSDIYNALYRELHEGFDEEYSPYPDDCKYFLKNCTDGEMIDHYTRQRAAKYNVAERNAQSMMSQTNSKSLIGRVRTQLDRYIRDINYGPSFAYGLLAAAKSHNFLNIVNGLIAENTNRWDQEAAQEHDRRQDYERSRDDFRNRRMRKLGDSDRKRYGDYEYFVMLYVQHQLAMECYEKLDAVLNQFKKQLEEAAGSYYVKLSRVVDTLINSFKENRDALASEKILQAKGAFSIPMMSIAELKDTLDEEIARINIPGMLDSFMGLLLDNEDAWITEDENKIAKLVNDFFVETAFGNFANRTITVFLKDKYRTTSDEELTNKIHTEWIKKLTAKATPLFPINRSIWPEELGKLAFVSIPVESAPIKAAAEKMYNNDHTWGIKESALTDRIFVMCSACAIPLSAYNYCANYEKAYFETTESGRHYYEGKAVPGMPFNDWRNLPSITPQSHFDPEYAPDTMKDIVKAAQALYDEAVLYAIFDDSNRICMPSEEGMDALKALTAEAVSCVAQISNLSEIPRAEELLAKLNAARKIPMVATKYAMQNDGYAAKRETKLSVQKDHFVAAPAYHAVVRDILKPVKELDTAADAAIALLTDKINRIRKGSRAINDYCDALFTGVISLEGRVITYRQNNFGIVTETVLSKRSAEFAFNAIPVYQGFLSYQTLLTADVKNAIKKSVDDRYNTDAPEIRATGTMLKTELADNKVQAWVMSAELYPEKAEILEFIMKLKQQFNIFCMENGI